jgi:predicted phage terminase large subunit-like protein
VIELEGITPNVLQTEIEKELARRSFWEYCKYVDSKFFVDNREHLVKISDAYQRVMNKSLKKLMISLPPRAGKSYTTTQLCAYALGVDGTSTIMRNTYGASLAWDLSGMVRDIVQSKIYKSLFPGVIIRRDRFKVDAWQLTESRRTSYFCGGIGGPITGKGCSTLAIMDDPFKNHAEGLSETYQQKTWEFYTGVHRARMEGDCAEILIGTRWSTEDLHGKLLELEPDEWEVINVPALDKEGQSFCEDLQPRKKLWQIKKITEDSIWASEYQQNPTEAEGKLFPSTELRTYQITQLRRGYAGILCFVDTATQGDDYLSAVVCKLYTSKDAKYPHLYITDVMFTQEDIPLTIPWLADLLQKHSVQTAIIEENGAGHVYTYALKEEMRKRTKCNFIEVNNWQNKEYRILQQSKWIKQYMHFRDDIKPGTDYDRFLTWLRKYVKYGKNKHDDAPDVLANCAEWIRGALCKEKPYVDKYRKIEQRKRQRRKA